MIGQVSPDGREAIVAVRVMPERGAASVDVYTVVDTGFTGELVLSSETLMLLSSPPQGVVDVELADGTVTQLSWHVAQVLWHGRARRVLAYETEGASLIGMALLGNSHLTIDVVPDGQVLITERRRAH
jgi:clan AA aspartic protease